MVYEHAEGEKRMSDGWWGVNRDKARPQSDVQSAGCQIKIENGR